MKQEYKDLIEGIDKMGEALITIGNSGDNKPIKMLVARLIGKLGFNNPEVGDDIAMIRFAVENDDESLEKLTANITGGQGEAPKKKAVVKAAGDVEYPEKETAE